MGQEFGSNTPSRIANPNLHMGFNALQLHIDSSPLGCKLDGVGEQIPYNLLQALGITHNYPDFRVKLTLDANLFGLGCWAHSIDCCLYKWYKFYLINI